MGKRIMAIPNRAKIIWQNVYSSFQSLDTLLAWFAIFVWLLFFTQSFTGLDGFINLIQRTTSGDWADFNWFVGGAWYMNVASGLYWVGVFMFFLVLFLLIRKICTKHKENEPLERIERNLGDITKSIDNLANEIRLDRESRGKKTNSNESTK